MISQNSIAKQLLVGQFQLPNELSDIIKGYVFNDIVRQVTINRKTMFINWFNEQIQDVNDIGLGYSYHEGTALSEFDIDDLVDNPRPVRYRHATCVFHHDEDSDIQFQYRICYDCGKFIQTTTLLPINGFEEHSQNTLRIMCSCNLYDFIDIEEETDEGPYNHQYPEDLEIYSVMDEEEEYQEEEEEEEEYGTLYTLELSANDLNQL
jgi:hypothetical protein